MQHSASAFTGNQPNYRTHLPFPTVTAARSAPKLHLQPHYPLSSDTPPWCVVLVHELRSAKREFDQAIQSVNIESTGKLEKLQSDVRCCATAAARDHKELRAIHSDTHGQGRQLQQLGSDINAIQQQLSSIAHMLALSDAEKKIRTIEVYSMSEQIRNLSDIVEHKLRTVNRSYKCSEATPTRRSLRLAARKSKERRSKAGRARTIEEHLQKAKRNQRKRKA